MQTDGATQTDKAASKYIRVVCVDEKTNKIHCISVSELAINEKRREQGNNNKVRNCPHHSTHVLYHQCAHCDVLVRGTNFYHHYAKCSKTAPLPKLSSWGYYVSNTETESQATPPNPTRQMDKLIRRTVGQNASIYRRSKLANFLKAIESDDT